MTTGSRHRPARWPPSRAGVTRRTTPCRVRSSSTTSTCPSSPTRSACRRTRTRTRSTAVWASPSRRACSARAPCRVASTPAKATRVHRSSSRRLRPPARRLGWLGSSRGASAAAGRPDPGSTREQRTTAIGSTGRWASSRPSRRRRPHRPRRRDRLNRRPPRRARPRRRPRCRRRPRHPSQSSAPAHPRTYRAVRRRSVNRGAGKPAGATSRAALRALPPHLLPSTPALPGLTAWRRPTRPTRRRRRRDRPGRRRSRPLACCAPTTATARSRATQATATATMAAPAPSTVCAASERIAPTAARGPHPAAAAAEAAAAAKEEEAAVAHPTGAVGRCRYGRASGGTTRRRM